MNWTWDGPYIEAMGLTLSYGPYIEPTQKRFTQTNCESNSSRVLRFSRWNVEVVLSLSITDGDDMTKNTLISFILEKSVDLREMSQLRHAAEVIYMVFIKS